MMASIFHRMANRGNYHASSALNASDSTKSLDAGRPFGASCNATSIYKADREHLAL
jgi:hypothetical protein